MTRVKRSRIRSNPNAAPIYEMTAALAGNACAEGTLPSVNPQHPLDTRKRTNSHFNDFDIMSGSENSIGTSASRKRKTSSYGTSSAYDEDCCDDSRPSSTRHNTPDKKQNHSEIEKRRRDKMNTYITELGSMIPMCGAMARKLDKLTVLRMAVQHLRTVRGSLSACPLTAQPRPAFVSERDLNAMILQAASDSFLIVVGCDRGRLLYVSQSVSIMLKYEQEELIGQSLFDILHPKDVAKIKEQLSSSDLSPRERLIDAKTMLPLKSDVVAGAQRLCTGARRSFLCRIKCKQSPEPAPAPVSSSTQPSGPVKEETGKTKQRKKNEKKYCVVQCTGYLKSWFPADMENGNSPEGDDEQYTMSCLVAIGRPLPEFAPPPPPATTPAPFARQIQYVSRHAIDGKFLFVDQRVTLALGFLPQELLGTSVYEYISGSDLAAVARAHKQALMLRDTLQTAPYSFRRKDGSVATIQTHFKPFRNPWTKEVECLVAKNCLLADAHNAENVQLHFEAFKQKGDSDVQQLIDSQVESHKIGSAIAEDAQRRPSSTSLSSPALLLQDPIFNTTMVDNILGMDLGPAQSPLVEPPSPPLPPLGLDGNGEAAMAVIMSLLEADAGLGGQVNFAGLPWPLP